jgi:membrane protease YdiL (CAAX protease family)
MNRTADHDRLAAVLSATGVGLAGFLAGLALLTLAVGILDVVVPLPEGTPERASVTLLAQYTGTLAVAAFYVQESGWSTSRLRLRRPTVRDAVLVVAGVLALFVVLTATTAALERLGRPVTEHSLARSAEDNPAMLLPLIPLSVLVTGPVEEFLYRGVVHTRLADAFDTGPTVVIAALVFMLVHLPAYYLGADGGSVVSSLAVVLVLGGLLGALYEYSGTLLVPAVAHGVYNAVTFGVEYLELTGGL